VKRVGVGLMVIVTIIACAHGKTDQFPDLVASPGTARVHVIRNINLWGKGFSLELSLDGVVIAKLRSGEHVSFSVAPGFHSLGVGESSSRAAFEKGKSYYFLISADYSDFGFYIERMDERKGQAWLNQTTALE